MSETVKQDREIYRGFEIIVAVHCPGQDCFASIMVCDEPVEGVVRGVKVRSFTSIRHAGTADETLTIAMQKGRSIVDRFPEGKLTGVRRGRYILFPVAQLMIHGTYQAQVRIVDATGIEPDVVKSLDEFSTADSAEQRASQFAQNEFGDSK